MNRRQFGLGLLSAAGAAALDPARAGAALRALAPPRVDGERLMRQLFALAEFGKNPQGGVSRVAYSEADLQGREYVLGLMREAGLEPRVDAAGNLVGRLPGSDPSRKPIAIGSHIDSVPNGGNYDGPVGSLAAIETARVLREQGISLRHPIEVLIFSNEEGGLIGSEALIGRLTEQELELVSSSGKTVREGIRFIGGDPTRLAEVRREPGDVAAYLELHIEQGGILEAEAVDIGVVEGIVGIGWWEAAWEGMANHAGTTPMDQRRDALVAAAQWVEAVNRVARETPGRQVATVGRLQVEPGAPNVIPGRVVASLEIRDLDAEKIDRLHRRIVAAAEEIAARTGTEVGFRPLISLEPAPADARVMGAIEAAAGELGLGTRRMPSGAGHDAQSMARLGPMGMIFVPSVGGISHAPQELTHPRDVVNGANVLLAAVLRLDGA